MTLKNKKILVTGADGFIGSHLTKKLVILGAKVRAMTFGKVKSLNDLKGNIEIARHDLNSLEKLGDLEFDAVFHLAALTDLKKCLEDPFLACSTNVLGTIKLLESCKKVGRFIIISTLGVYGEPRYLPIDENHPTLPIEPYAASKAAAESFVSGICSSRKIHYRIARLFNVYGPGQKSDFVIPQIINQALNRDEVILKNQNSTRDFIYIGDVIDSLIMIALKGKDGIYNIGSGKETSILELTKIMQKFIDRKISFKFIGEARTINVQRSLADIRKIRKDVGWAPSTDLNDGIRKTLNYYNDI